MTGQPMDSPHPSPRRYPVGRPRMAHTEERALQEAAEESPPLRLRLVESKSEWAALRPGWERLLRRSRDAAIFGTWEWLSGWMEVFFEPPRPGTRKLHALVMEDDRGELLAVAPLYRDHPRGFGAGVLRLLADTHVCSDYLGFPVVVEREVDFARLLAGYFTRSRASSVLLLSAVRDGSFVQEVFLPALVSTAGFWRLELKRDICPRVQLGPDFKGAYGRKYEKLKKTGQVTIGHPKTVEETERDLDVLFRLHQANWTRRGEPGSFDTESKRTLYRWLAREMVPLDMLRLYSLRVDGVTVATNIGFAYRDEWYGMQAGYEESFRRHSVGAILQGQILEGLRSEGFQRAHFLRGDEAYKQEHWNADPFYQRDYCLFRPTAMNVFRYYAPHLARRIKGRLRSRPRP